MNYIVETNILDDRGKTHKKYLKVTDIIETQQYYWRVRLENGETLFAPISSFIEIK